MAGLEVLRALPPRARRRTVTLVDWADEEGARFGRSLFGSSAVAEPSTPTPCAGSRPGRHALPDVLARHGVDLDRAHEARARLDGVPPTSSCTSSRARCSRAWTSRSASCSARSAWSATASVHGRRARGHDPDGPAPRRVPRRRTIRARLPRGRRGARRRPRDDRHREGLAGHRDGVQRHVRAVARPAPRSTPASSPTCCAAARAGAERIAAEEDCDRRVGARVGDRADPVRRGPDRPRRRGPVKGIAGAATGCRAARCTTRPRWPAFCRP